MKKIITIAALAVVCAGCSTGVVPMGKDTYMIARRGTVYTPEFTLEARCLKEAGKYCKKRGQAMVFISKSGHDGGVGMMSTCEVIFMMVPTNSPLNVPHPIGKEELVK